MSDIFSPYNFYRARGEFRNWASQDCKEIFYNFSDNLAITDEIVYRNLPGFNKFKDSSILLIGGGPSTDSINWNEKDHDYCWSMNHFYLNKRLTDTKLDLVMLNAGTDLNNSKLQNYLNSYKPLVGFDIHNRWFENPRKKFVNNKFYITKNLFCSHSRFYSKLGYGIRMIVLAANLGVREVSFVGLDGFKPLLKGSHAFQPGKTSLPQFVTPQNGDEVFTRQYTEFWTYMKDKFLNTKCISLDPTNKYHKELL